MFFMLHITALDKTEADELCDGCGIQRREINHASRGWSYTALSFNGERCGEITPRAVGKPLTLAIDLGRINSPARKRLMALASAS